MSVPRCILCDRDVPRPRWGVNYDCETQAVVSPDTTTPGSGIQIIGSECRRKVPRGWAFSWSPRATLRRQQERAAYTRAVARIKVRRAIAAERAERVSPHVVS